MRILIIIDEFLGSNGVARVNFNLAKEWIKLGNQVTILTFKYDDFCSNIKVLNLNQSLRKRIWSSKQLKKDIFDIIEKEKPDSIFNNAGKLGLIVSSKYKTFSRYGGIISADIIHGIQAGLKATIFNLWMYIVQLLCIKRSICAFCPSKYGATKNKKFFFRRLVVINNGIDKNKFRPSGKRQELGINSLIFVGEITEGKGIRFLLKSFRRIKRKVPEVKLYMFGRNSDNKLRSLIKKESSVIYMGVSDKIEEYLRGARVFIFPSYSESFSNVLVEAQACGKPIVAFNLEPISEVVKDGYSGFLIKKNDLNTFSDKVVELLNNKCLRDKMGRNAIKYSKKYSWRISAKKYLKLFRNFN